jgi:uncharacterized protein (TIGR02145 family)
MTENLAYLPSVSPSAEDSDTDPYYYVYDYQGSNVTEAKVLANLQTYGVLYNWVAALNACPSGWHLPTDDEWKTLEMHLGMSQEQADDKAWRGTDEGGKLKETGTSHWTSPNAGATNESGFTALPGGCRSNDGNFYYLGDNAYLWSATWGSASYSLRRYIRHDSANVNRRSQYKGNGFSVRCIMD